ncbi:MAG: tetratricopeptide repeat protein [Acidobacteriota bacterium]|nr:tetratricopeptide repeat protein [Acidobacteriota bacterium]
MPAILRPVPLVDLLAGRPAEIELDEAALEIARLEYPDLDAARYIRLLDDYAFEIATRADDLSDGPSFLQAANAVLFEDMGFKGDSADYYNPDNAYLNRVLETRKGMPIVLSLIYMEIARRLAKPVYGIGLPGHFLIQYNDGAYSVYIDPFNQALARVESANPADLVPADKRSIAMRLLNNLRYIYFERQDSERAIRVLNLLLEADPGAADEYKQRAVAHLQLQQFRQAAEDFKRYLELNPKAADRDRVEEHLRNLTFWQASKN